jgi:hypothetical protein
MAFIIDSLMARWIISSFIEQVLKKGSVVLQK